MDHIRNYICILYVDDAIRCPIIARPPPTWTQFTREPTTLFTIYSILSHINIYTYSVTSSRSCARPLKTRWRPRSQYSFSAARRCCFCIPECKHTHTHTAFPTEPRRRPFTWYREALPTPINLRLRLAESESRRSPIVLFSVLNYSLRCYAAWLTHSHNSSGGLAMVLGIDRGSLVSTHCLIDRTPQVTFFAFLFFRLSINTNTEARTTASWLVYCSLWSWSLVRHTNAIALSVLHTQSTFQSSEKTPGSSGSGSQVRERLSIGVSEVSWWWVYNWYRFWVSVVIRQVDRELACERSHIRWMNYWNNNNVTSTHTCTHKPTWKRAFHERIAVLLLKRNVTAMARSNALMLLLMMMTMIKYSGYVVT